MKAIRLSDEQKETMFNKYKKTLEDEYSDKLVKYLNSLNGVTPQQESTKAEEKLKIYYTAEAYAKIVQLVFSHAQEIGWNMVVKPYNDGFRIENVLVYPQKASAAYVSVDLERYALWKGDPDKVSDEDDAFLFGQGHSHVNMGTEPSSRDKQQQLDEINLLGSGYYLFQIWNKRMEINSFFYDLDNNVFYDKNDIELIVEDGDKTSTEFVEESKEMLIQETKTGFTQARKEEFEPFESKAKKRKKPRSMEEILEEKETVYLNGYYPGYGNYEYDW